MKHLLRKYFPQWFPVEKRVTAFNRLEVRRQGNRLVLNAPHVNYAFGSLHDLFREAFSRKPPCPKTTENILILGFGGGSVAHILREELDCNNPITGVEIDPAVIDLSLKYFDLNRLKDITIDFCDAAEFLAKDKKQYGLLVVDLFSDHIIPEKFQTKMFLKQLAGHLTPEGTVFYNFLLYDFKAKKQFSHLEELFKTTFRQTETMTFSKQPKSRILMGKHPRVKPSRG